MPSKWKMELKTHNNASNKSVPNNGLHVRKMLSVSLPYKTAKINAEPNSPAGKFVSLERKIKLQLMLLSVLLPMTVSRWRLEFLNSSRLLSNVSSNTAKLNNKIASMTEDVPESLTTATTNAIVMKTVGRSVLPSKKMTMLTSL